MNEAKAKEILKDAVQRLKVELGEFGASIGERTIVFRIAHYMACAVEDGYLSVDCDYNREGDDVKKFLGRPKEECHDGTCTKRFFPDIVLHKRKSGEKNILVCEIKKASDPRGPEIDHRRLEMLTSKIQSFRYLLGAFIKIQQSPPLIEVTYFKDGKKFGNHIEI